MWRSRWPALYNIVLLLDCDKDADGSFASRFNKAACLPDPLLARSRGVACFLLALDRPRSPSIPACVGSDSGWHPPFRDEATERGALVDREGGQKRREGIMAQLLNRLRAEERIAGVEFWHSPERCGWLMKQGTFLLLSRKKLSTPPLPPSHAPARDATGGNDRGLFRIPWLTARFPTYPQESTSRLGGAGGLS